MAGKRLANFEKKALPRVETTEKSRMAGKRLAKFEKKALPRVELGFFSPPAAPAAGCIVSVSRRSAQVASALTHRPTSWHLSDPIMACPQGRSPTLHAARALGREKASVWVVAAAVKLALRQTLVSTAPSAP